MTPDRMDQIGEVLEKVVANGAALPGGSPESINEAFIAGTQPGAAAAPRQ